MYYITFYSIFEYMQKVANQYPYFFQQKTILKNLMQHNHYNFIFVTYSISIA